MRLVLFDIDGTLLTAHGAGRRALTRAMEDTFGTAGDVEAYDFRGSTDPRIVRDLLSTAGIPEVRIDTGLAPCFETYVRHLQALLLNGGRVDVLPGAGEVVRALAARADVVVGLLTGNIEAGARVKLEPTGLWPYFRLGAYGSDHDDRRQLPAIACRRAVALTGSVFPFDRVAIVGDTPRDVDCARACGARALAVASGQHSAQELSACGPDLVLPDLRDVERVLRALTAA